MQQHQRVRVVRAPRVCVTNARVRMRLLRAGTGAAALAAPLHCLMAYDTQVRVSGTVVQPIEQEGEGALKLEDYMRLPVAQYASLDMPFQASLKRLPDAADTFELRVPPVSFRVPGVNLTVVPRLVATVTAARDHVLIASDACELSGSPLIEAVRLNERFRFRVRTRFTWADAPLAITSRSAIEVDVDPPGPFQLVPRRLLEATGNRVMSFAMNTLQAAFLRSLADDYARWASDAGYLEARERSDLASR